MLVEKKKTTKRRAKVVKSIGNVFADIGLPNAEAHSVKADLVIAIGDIIRAKGLTQAQAATRLGLAQPDVSKLLRGQFSGYTYDRLFSYLNALGEKVRIKVSEAKTKSVTFTRVPGVSIENDRYVCEQSVDNFNFLVGNEYKERDIIPYTNKSGWKVVINRKKG